MDDEGLGEEPLRPSKTRQKREMHALQQLGEQLAALPAERLQRIALPETLRDALLAVQRMTRLDEARRRQMQYVGRLMRDVDVLPIRTALEEMQGLSAAANARLHRLERLRERLMADEQVLGELARDYPGADLTRLRQLRRNALLEAERGKPPRARRELFRALRALDAGAPQEWVDERGDDDA